MKLKRNKQESDSDSMYSKGSLAGWAETNPESFKTLAKQAKQNSIRIPEFWVPEDARRLIRFVDVDPVVSFKVYSVKIGKMFERFIQPKPGKSNIFQEVLGLRPQQKFVYRIIDIEGYKGRKGTRTNVARFYAVGARIFEQISLLRKENADSGELNEYNVSVSRTGSGTDTAYMFMPKPPTPMTPEMKKAIRKFPDWREFYKPTSNNQQQELLARLGVSSDDDDE